MLGISPESSIFDRSRQFAIVVGSALFVALPMSQLASIFLSQPFNHSARLVPVLFVPGVVFGLLVALGRLPEIHARVWQISFVGWVLTAGLWKGMGVRLAQSMNVAPPLLAFIVGFGVAALVGFRDRVSLDDPIPG
jgi:hypothetical protein